jgi:hypothetical protein
MPEEMPGKDTGGALPSVPEVAELVPDVADTIYTFLLTTLPSNLSKNFASAINVSLGN